MSECTKDGEAGPRALSRHDRLAAERLADGTVRLLSADWLRKQQRGLVLSRRQELPDDAFISCEEARALFEGRTRGVGALSYGWLHPLHSDPHGFNTAIVIDFLRSERGRHVRAMFWDFASLPQKDEHGDRTKEECEVFGRGLRYMPEGLERALASVLAYQCQYQSCALLEEL